MVRTGRNILIFIYFWIPISNILASENILRLINEAKRPESFPANYRVNSEQKSSNLSIYYLKRAIGNIDKNIRLALHYLTKAKEKNNKRIKNNIAFYEALSLAKIGKSKESNKAIQLLSQLEKSRSIGRLQRFEIRNHLLEIAKTSNNNTKYERMFNKFIKNRFFRNTVDKHYYSIALINEKNGKYKKMFSLLESLAASYPITVYSRKAFTKLVDYTCPEQTKDNRAISKPKSQYHFSYKLLTKLGRHLGLDPSLKGFLKEMSEAVLRLKSRATRPLTSLEQVEFLYDARIYDDAYKKGKLLLKEEGDKFEEKDREKLLLLLGKLANRQFLHQQAAKYFSIFNQSPGTSKNKRKPKRKKQLKIQEFLADSLSYGGFRNIASDIYGNIAARTNDKLTRWHHFWNKYAANDTGQLDKLFLKSRRRYVPPRDKLQPHGPKYWKARVLEKNGKIKEATQIYKQLLNKNTDDIYAIFINLRHPQLTTSSSYEKNNPKKEPQRSSIERDWIHDINNKKNLKITNGKILHILDLFQAGLKKETLYALDNLKLRKLVSKDRPIVSLVSNKIGAAHLQQDATRKYLLKYLPKLLNWDTITSHQKKYTNIWKSYYPLAYKEDVFKISKNLKIDPYFVLSIMRIESRYDKHALSYVGAQGLMQIMPYTSLQIARRIGHIDFKIEDMWKPKINIAYGAWYLKQLLQLYENSPILAATAYNAGPVATNSWINRCNKCEFDEFIESIPYKETRRYVKNIIKTYARYYRIYEDRQNLDISSTIPVNLSSENDFF